MDGDINQRIAEERARIAQKERDYDQAHAICVAQLTRLGSDLTAILGQGPEAASEIGLPSLSTARCDLDSHYDVSDWYYWERFAEYIGWHCPTLSVFHTPIFYNPFLDQWKYQHGHATREQVIEWFSREITKWAVAYPSVRDARERKAVEDEANRRRWAKEERSRRDNKIIQAIVIVAMWLFIIYGLPALINSAAK
ncbi:MAG: hypothetical protein QOG72_1682 [Sphingomonadales bacterium]|jgi:hypothetical protein|nr:hypothetical protein [Sphingomonadales bacterium]